MTSTDKYKDLRDALESGSLALEHVAVAEGGGLRWMTGRKMRSGVASVELHSIPSGRRVHGRIAVDQDTIRTLLADCDAANARLHDVATLCATVEQERDALREALTAAVECGMVPKSSVSDGGASAHARQVVVADMIRAALAQHQGEKHG